MGERGDCMRAAVASLLELPYEAVPHFLEPDVDGWYERWLGFWEDLGIYPEEVDTGKGGRPAYPHLASGMSPRGRLHMFIMDGFRVIHDPHPAGGQEDARTFTRLVVVDPSRLHRLEALRRQS